jgi:plastocyanin
VSRSRTALVVVLPLLLASACSSGPVERSEEDLAALEGADVALVGQDELTWDQEEVSAEAGTVTFALACEAAVNHNLVIDGEEVAACAPGATETGELELDAGEYPFFCTIPGHEATMRGQLTVE